MFFQIARVDYYVVNIYFNKIIETKHSIYLSLNISREVSISYNCYILLLAIAITNYDKLVTILIKYQLLIKEASTIYYRYIKKFYYRDEYV